jgi:hypothetical protein
MSDTYSFGRKCGALGCRETDVLEVEGEKGTRVLCTSHAADYVGRESLQIQVTAEGDIRV